MVKMTFTLDDETASVLRKTTERMAKPQSVIVREAIREYGARAGRLSEDERRRMLRSIDAVLSQLASRTAGAVERELQAVRRARRRGGRRSA
ncbi:MAG: ribbon-helix-helix protein, CopG family [Vicinamibacterales bacterium]